MTKKVKDITDTLKNEHQTISDTFKADFVKTRTHVKDSIDKLYTEIEKVEMEKRKENYDKIMSSS